ncbi:MAG: succinate dehydrogenase, cytochrome b556 subunit [Steroidobacteraceae bacterium]|jgi:succinate dehydrogenase / fumarate reductase cytochrome b subunit
MPVRARPLSPHLQIYRWQVGSTLSILHRITGLALALGFLALTYWLVALAGGAAAYSSAARFFAGPLAGAALVGWTFAFFYHLLNGIRHLAWDVGVGFDRAHSRLSGLLAMLAAVLLTAGLWGFLWHVARP